MEGKRAAMAGAWVVVKGWSLSCGPRADGVFSSSCGEHHWRWWRWVDLRGNHGQQCPEILKQRRAWDSQGLFHQDHVCHSQECPQLSPGYGESHTPSPHSHKRALTLVLFLVPRLQSSLENVRIAFNKQPLSEGWMSPCPAPGILASFCWVEKGGGEEGP